MRSFLKQKGYYQGVIFLILMMVVSCINDVISKFIGQRLDAIEVLFFRFFFAFVTLLPFALSRRRSVFHTKNIKINIFRGVLGAISLYLYTYSVVKLPIVEVVTILWTIPLFVLVLSVIFLREHVTCLRWVATIVGFVGLAFVTLYDSGTNFSFKILYLIPAASALLFAIQDVMIKRMVDDESKITMLLYFSIVTSAITLIPALMVWVMPTLFELILLLILGAFGNLIQVFLFKAFNATDLSALAPYRYIEFIFSAIAGYIVFNDMPGMNVIIGAVILIQCTLYIAYTDKHN